MKKVFIAFCCLVVIGLGIYAVSPSFSKEKVINVIIEQYCENGEFKNGQCEVITSIPAETTCPEGFPINLESHYCERVVSVQARPYDACDPGFKLTGGRCISEASSPKDENGACPDGLSPLNGECKEIRYRYVAYRCPSGTLNSETNKCEFADQKTPVVTCPEGYIVNAENLTCDVIAYEPVKEREVRTEEE